MLLLEQNITRKKQVEESLIYFKASDNNKYKIKTILNSIFSIKKLKKDYLIWFYYLMLKKLFKKNSLKIVLAMKYFQKLINLFYKNYLNKI